MRLIEEIVVPGRDFDHAINIEELQRVVAGNHGVACTRGHVGVVVLELVLFKDLLVNQKITHSAVFDLNKGLTSLRTKSCT